MLFRSLKVKPAHRMIVLQDDRIRTVLPSGSHWLWHGMQDIHTFSENISDLNVVWDGMAAALRFERDTVARYWRIIDSAPGSVTVVWHRYMAAQVVGSGLSRAFWPPEEGELETHTIAQDDYWLPETVQAALLMQPKLTRPLQKFTVNAGEQLLITVRDQPVRILGEGEYVLHMNDGHTKALFAHTRMPLFEDLATVSQWAAHTPALIEQAFEHVVAAENELILWTLNGVLHDVILPGNSGYFWRQAALPYAFIRIDLRQGLLITPEVVAQLQTAHYQTHPVFQKIVLDVNVPQHHQGLVFIEHQLQTPLPQGHYHYWQVNQLIHSTVVDLRLQTSEIAGQELLSADKVTIRANVTCNYRITDAPLWLQQHSDSAAYLYRELQFAVRAIIGAENMDTLLSDKQAIDQALTTLMQSKNWQGIAIDSVGIKDIILPGDMKALLAQVVEAEKAAQANVIRRREETAATRSLLNTARVMEENPTALRLKELETLEKVTEKIDKISVFGGLDGVLNGLINIQTTPPK